MRHMRATKLLKLRKDRVVKFRCDISTANRLKTAAVLAHLDLSDFIRIAALAASNKYSFEQPELPGLH